jgi:hypothetical protein
MDNRHTLDDATTTDDFIREMMEDEGDGAGFTQAYLRAGILSSAVEMLYTCRKSLALTQEDIASKLHTKQPAIAKLEADVKGAMSLHRYVDFAMACGKVPLIMLVEAKAATEYVQAHPETPLTADGFMAWKTAVHQADDSQVPAQMFAYTDDNPWFDSLSLSSNDSPTLPSIPSIRVRTGEPWWAYQVPPPSVPRQLLPTVLPTAVPMNNENQLAAFWLQPYGSYALPPAPPPIPANTLRSPIEPERKVTLASAG